MSSNKVDKWQEDKSNGRREREKKQRKNKNKTLDVKTL